MEGPDGIHIPSEFITFAQLFFFDGDDPPDMTVDALIEKALGSVPRQGGRVSVLEDFLSRLLHDGVSDVVLDEIWFRAEPTYPMRRGHHRANFAKFRDAARAWVRQGKSP